MTVVTPSAAASIRRPSRDSTLPTSPLPAEAPARAAATYPGAHGRGGRDLVRSFGTWGWSQLYGTPRAALAELGPGARLADPALEVDRLDEPPPLTGVDKSPELARRVVELRAQLAAAAVPDPGCRTASTLADVAATDSRPPDPNERTRG